MFNGSTPFTMPVAPTSGFGNSFGDGAWWIIILLIFAWNGGWGNGYGNNAGAADNYVLASDFATLQRQIDSTTASTQNMITTNGDALQRQVTSVANGLSSLGYDQLNQINGVNNNIFSSTNALTAQLSNCCCENRAATKDLQYALATQSNATNNLISTGFSDINYNMASQDCAIRQTVTDVGRNLADVQNANTREVLAAIQSIKDSAKDEKIATLTSQLSDARLIANNAAQTTAIQTAISDAVTKLTPPTPIPAFQVNNPWQYSGCGCTGCGC